MKKSTYSYLAAAVAVLTPVVAHASVLTSGGTSFQTGTPTPTLGFNAPFTLSVTTAGSVSSLVFDEWVTSDGTASQVTPIPNGQLLTFSINGGATQTVVVGGLVDNRVTTVGSITPNDGFIFFPGIPVNAGDTLTILRPVILLTQPPASTPERPQRSMGWSTGPATGG